MIHFLISHSISLYFQTERKGEKGTDMRGRGGMDDGESKKRKERIIENGNK